MSQTNSISFQKVSALQNTMVLIRGQPKVYMIIRDHVKHIVSSYSDSPDEQEIY